VWRVAGPVEVLPLVWRVAGPLEVLLPANSRPGHAAVAVMSMAPAGLRQMRPPTTTQQLAGCKHDVTLYSKRDSYVHA